jgi:hypothetical protein
MDYTLTYFTELILVSAAMLLLLGTLTYSKVYLEEARLGGKLFILLAVLAFFPLIGDYCINLNAMSVHGIHIPFNTEPCFAAAPKLWVFRQPFDAVLALYVYATWKDSVHRIRVLVDVMFLLAVMATVLNIMAVVWGDMTMIEMFPAWTMRSAGILRTIYHLALPVLLFFADRRLFLYYLLVGATAYGLNQLIPFGTSFGVMNVELLVFCHISALNVYFEDDRTNAAAVGSIEEEA